MTTTVEATPQVRSVVETAIAKHGATREALMPILSEVNQALGYLPRRGLRRGRPPAAHPGQPAVLGGQLLPDAVHQAARAARDPVLRKRTLPRGRRPPGLERAERGAGIGPGETSADGKWTLETTSCLGVCAVGPVIVIDDDIYGNVTPKQVPDILARYVGATLAVARVVHPNGACHESNPLFGFGFQRRREHGARRAGGVPALAGGDRSLRPAG